MKATDASFTERRKDGWPLCPRCGEDELWSNEPHDGNAYIAGCYRCTWEPPE